MTQEKFTHGRYDVETVYNEGGESRFRVLANNGDLFFVILHSQGAEISIPQDCIESTISFGGPRDFDELRDLITFLHGRVKEEAT